MYSPDGASVYFVSDREGSPQIYVCGTDGSGVRRISYGGGYNVSPAISPDGKSMAYIAQQGSSFTLRVLDLASGQSRQLGDGPNDGRPPFAPTDGGVEVLRTVSLDGSVRTTLATSGQQVREPAWGPWTRAR